MTAQEMCIINGIQSKDMFNMSSPFNSLHLIQELNLKNQQTLHLTI